MLAGEQQGARQCYHKHDEGEYAFLCHTAGWIIFMKVRFVFKEHVAKVQIFVELEYESLAFFSKIWHFRHLLFVSAENLHVIYTCQIGNIWSNGKAKPAS